jgi:hypothetical protein
MKHTIFIFFVLTSLLFVTSSIFAQSKSNASQAKTITLYEYERYDQNGNTCISIEAPTTELRYDCPVCKGARVLNIKSTGVPVNVSCWRCNGKGYLVSNTGK